MKMQHKKKMKII
jgi:hypothetical protein